MSKNANAKRSRISAGLLMFRRRNDQVEVLLAHPGGPFHVHKDDGAWTIPKGEAAPGERSEEHTSELQSRLHLVCRLLLEKKKEKDALAVLCQSGALRWASVPEDDPPVWPELQRALCPAVDVDVAAAIMTWLCLACALCTH